MEAEPASLRRELESLRNQPPRPAAPFRIKEHKRQSNPKRPGRKPGHEGSCRQAPEVTETVTVPLEECPHCGGTVDDIQKVEQVIEEIPPVQLRVIGLTTFQGRCGCCGEVRSTHPLQVSTAVGAAGTHPGPNALSLIARLQHRWHLSKRKSCDLLKEIFGLSPTPGGLVGAIHRLAAKLAAEHKALPGEVRHCDVLHSDETGWYAGAPGHTLWVFTNPQITLYRIVAHRTREQLQQIIGKDFPGVLVSDCLSIYDEASPVQQKCCSHHLKAVSKARDSHPRNGEGFLNEVRLMLKCAMILKSAKEEVHPRTCRKSRLGLEQWAGRLLSQPRGDPNEESVRMRLLKQQDHLFTFLWHDAVEAANNLAERQLRLAVIDRKLSCGNRTQKGAGTWEVMASIAVTCRQRGESLDDLIVNALSRSLQPALAR